MKLKEVLDQMSPDAICGLAIEMGLLDLDDLIQQILYDENMAERCLASEGYEIDDLDDDEE